MTGGSNPRSGATLPNLPSPMRRLLTMSLQRAAMIHILPLMLAPFGCRKADVECVQPPAVLVCPEAGSPSFATDVFPKVFVPVCDSCHAPGEHEVSPLLTNYREIYGPTTGPSAGSKAKTIFTRVFNDCSMPPSDAPLPLDADQRQILLDWFACGAPDSPPLDAGASD
jgi:hypothetical protein